MAKMEMLRELWSFLKKRKLYWLAPILIVNGETGAIIGIRVGAPVPAAP